MENITVLVIEPEKKPYVKNISGELKSLQQEVGGYIQAIYPWEEPCAIICNEEGKLTGLPFNRALRNEDGDIYDIIAGTFLVVGLGEENFASLESKYIQRFGEMFAVPEVFIRMQDKIAVLPLNPQKENANE